MGMTLLPTTPEAATAIDVTADVTQAGELDLGFDGDVFFSLYLKKEGPLGAATQPIPQSPTYRARAEKGIAVARLVLETAGEVAVRIYCGSCVSTITHFFAVTELTARRLVVSRQPSPSVAGVPLPVQPVVTVVQADGSPARGRVVLVATLLVRGIQPELKAHALLGTKTIETTEDGVGVFEDLAVSLVGDGFFLGFALAEPYSSFPPTFTWPFAIEHGPASGLRFAIEPPAEFLPGEQFSVSIDIVDAWGNSVSGTVEDTDGNPAEITLGLAGTSSSSTSLRGVLAREATGGPLLFDSLAVTGILKGDLQLEASCVKCKLVPVQSRIFKISLTNIVRISKCPLLYEDAAVSTEVPSPSSVQGTYGFSFNTCVYRITLLADKMQLLAPKHDVTVTIAGVELKDPVPGLQGEMLPEERIRVTPRTLTFSPSNYHIPQDVLLEVVDDNEIVASIELTNIADELFVGDYIIHHTMSSADTIWNDGNVKWQIDSGEAPEGTEHFIDFMEGGSEAANEDRAFITEGNLMVRVVDDDKRRVFTKVPSTIRMEGEQMSYTVWLSMPPSPGTNVTVKMESALGSRSVVLDPEVLVFTRDDWQTPRNVSVNTEDDNIALPPEKNRKTLTWNQIEVIQIAQTVMSDDNFVMASTSIGIAVRDNDRAGFEFEDTAVVPEGSAASASFRLRSQPVGPVTIRVQCDGAHIRADFEDHESLLIQPLDWNTTQSVTLHADFSEATLGPEYKAFCKVIAESADENYNSVSWEENNKELPVYGFTVVIYRPGLTSGDKMTATVCPVGQSLQKSTVGDVDKWECRPCPRGHRCPHPLLKPEKCGDGKHPMSRNGCPDLCPAGEVICGMHIPHRDHWTFEACDPGYFFYPKLGGSYCLPCPAGNYCPKLFVMPTPCPRGTYCPQQSIQPKPCTAGFYCARPWLPPEPCPYGMMSGPGADRCTPCPEGYSCPDAPLMRTQKCPDKTRSFLRNPKCLRCDDRGDTYCSHSAHVNICYSPEEIPDPDRSRCIPCPAGHECILGKAVPCPAGFYAEEAGGICRPCEAGHLCAEREPGPNTGRYVNGPFYKEPGVIEVKVCPPGTFSWGIAFTSHDGCQPCGAGVYCPYNTNELPTICAANEYCPEGTLRPLKSPPLTEGYTLSNGDRTTGLAHFGAFRYCKFGQTNLSLGGTCTQCPRGQICRIGSAPINCPPGTYAPGGPGATEPCKPCPEGKICHLAGMEHPVTCPAGTRHFNADPSGTEPAEYPQDRQENVVYQGPNTMASSLMACTKCAAGTYCQGGGATSQKCPDRHFCPEGTETPVHCPPGTTTKAGVGAKGESDCTPCPPGFACNSGKEEQCEAGYYCPEGTRYKHEFPCPGGTYSGQGKAKCTSCPAGRYCPPASTTPKNCPAGYYCLAGSDNPWNTPCPVNTFSARPNLTREQECLKCRKNEYCPVATVDPLPCPQEKLDPALGIECSLVALKRCQVGEYLGSSSCLACKPGYYCGSAGMSEEDMLDHPCPAGYTCPTPGLSSGTATKCPAGSYCLTGTSDAQGILCRPGTYNDELGAASAEECQPLPAGVYSGGGAKTAAGDGKCDAGYYCPEGSTVPHAVPCPRGTYLNQPGGQREEDCLPCAPGTYCDTVAETQPLSCPAGHYCLGGTHLPVPCPVGTFRTDPDGDSLEACTACPAGKYCPLLGAVEDAGDCEAGYLCIRGATVSTPTDGVTGSLCPLGYYCGSGAQQPESCPQGAYIPFAGSTSQDDCISCKPGFYCDGSDKANPLKPCFAGSYCTGGARTGTQHPVPEGHYSPAGSSGPVACLPGTFQNERSQAQCKPCTEGYYCPELGMSQPTECGAGRYCPAGSSAPLLCPPGTFSSAATASVVSECAACTAGHYCSGPGASVETGKCAPGYFCKSGSRSPTPEDAAENFGPCPAGTYCDVGTHTPTPCNAGTYGPSPRAVDEKACVPCDAGSFCDQPGLTKPVGPCGEGYYCEAGSDRATPTGKECPAGKKCPGGSPAPSPCQPGTYQSQQGQSTCVECSAGSYCGVAATGETPCPAGSFCPPGTKHGQENLCPPGTFRANTGATSLSDCTPCGEGDFCGNFGLTQASGKCKAGFYCKQYNIVSQPLTSDCYFAAPVRGGQTTTCHNTIPAGFTSKVDAFEACSASEDCEGVVKTVDGRFHLRCGVYTAAGEYRDTIFYWRICWEGGRCGPGELCAAGASEPVACPVGHYCQATAASQEQGPCPAGYLCPDGSLNTMEAASLCPKGHFCVNGIAEACPEGKYLPARGGRSEKECLDCPAGFYCSGTGKEEPTGTCDPGYFCAKGANSAQHAACPGGHYCPRGAVEAIPCPAGTVQPDSGQESCLPCSTGNYCEFGATEGKPCPAGYYCPSASGTGTSFPCPIGTFSAQEGVTSADTCTKCLAGHFCDVPGLTKPVGKCLPGYYCPVGTGLRYPKTFCPPGSYCPRGSSQPADCPANYYCDTSRLSEPTAACSPGFICGARSTTPTPTQAISGSACSENLQGYKCPAGYYCPPALTRLVAGVGYPGKSAEGVDASKAFLNGPQDAVRTSNGDIFIADTGNQRVARLDAVTGEVTTYIGQGLRQGDSSWILTAKPTRLALSPNQETLYILYSDVARVVQHTLSNAKTTEVVDARGCSSPQGFAVDPTGSALYIADTGNNRIRKVPVAPPSRATDLFGQAQTDTADNPPDQGPKLDRPSAVWVSSNGVVYIADAGNGRIRRFQQAAGPQSGAQLTTIVGGPVAGVKLESPVALTGFEAGGKVFLVAYDAGVQMVLKIDTSESTPTKVDLFDASRAGNGHVDSQIQSRFGSVQMETPTGDTVAALFGDPERHRIRRIFLNPDYEEPVGKKVPCPAGTYLDYDGAYAESHCKECPAGKYCRGTGLTQPTGDCAGGFTCDARSEQPEGTPCPVGHFCPASSGASASR
ncbi:GCC2 and GCC3 domain-containing protein [Toxoplasma gondii GT1]|uniref:GCC2 and GCC3 domain-containing protein n=1 Tax=Toxoplasma gondii (strain ATCC 50853 / GT1) TaxID=507601 RepID=S7UIS4_TOXGG|nr:GCC2 and GCC3 domain-containing protein [Toxoplasma gondii GT1]